MTVYGGSENSKAQHSTRSGKNRTGGHVSRDEPATNDRRAGRGRPADRQHLSDASYRNERAEPSDWEFSVPRPDWFRENPHRRSDGRSPDQESAGSHQNR